MPYSPSRGYDDHILQLILQRGENQARGALESGAIWGNAVAGIGQQVGGAIQQYGEQKQIAKRDATWLQYVQSGEWQKDPKAAYTAAKAIWGPDGDKQFQSLMGVAQLMGEKRDPAADSKSLGALIGGMDSMTEGGRAAAYPQAAALAKRVYPELQLSPEYDPKQWAEISPLGKALRGEKAPGTREVKVRNADGTESIEIVEDKPGQKFTSAAEPPKPPTLQHVETAEGIRTFNPQTGEMGPVIGQSKPLAPKEPPKPSWVQGEDAEGNPIFYDAASGAVKPFPEGVTPKAGAAEAGRIAGAKAALEASSEIKDYLSRPEVRKAIGPLIGRYNSLAQAAGVGDPYAIQLVGMLKSYSALQPNIHGFRAVQFAADIEKLLSTKQTPESLEAAIRGIDTAAINVRDRGRHPAGAAAEGGPKRVSTDAEYNALPSGTEFIDPEGKRRRKP